MIKLFSKFKKHHKSVETTSTLNPHKHWTVILGIFFTLVVSVIFFSLYLLFQIRNENVFQVKPTLDDKPTLLREDLLKSVTASFENKAQKEKDLIENAPTYSDPSL